VPKTLRTTEFYFITFQTCYLGVTNTDKKEKEKGKKMGGQEEPAVQHPGVMKQS